MNRGPGELERAVMNVLWAQPEPLTARSVLRELGDAELAYTTVKTVLDRLHRKRLVHREPAQRAWRYYAAGGRDDHVSELMLHALDQTGDRDGALIRFARAVSDTDAEVLRQALADARQPTGESPPSPRDRPGRAGS
ncbi:MAG: BlaI/MecI/CopY family transcriptional regulator [Pseudonocardiaceae bacterium]